MTSVLFIIFHLMLYLFGRGFILLLIRFTKLDMKTDNISIGNLNLKYFYPVIGLFAIGNFTVLINFFLPINNNFIKILFMFIILTNLLDRNMKFDLKSIMNLGIIPFILSISSYGINLAQDAGLYHLNTQSWLRQEKIHLGLSNIHSRYGYSSLFDYISSNFWLNDNFLLIHFVNLTFIVLFFVFIFQNIFNKNRGFLNNLSVLIVLFGILDNFGMAGGRNGFIDIEAVTKYDTPFAIIYFLTGCLIINNLLNESYELFQFFVVLYLLLFAIQLRIFGMTLIPLFLVLGFRVFKKYKLQKILSSAVLPIFMFSVWIIKNVLITSCLFFPVEQFCFSSLPWSDISSATLEANDLKSFHIFYSLNQRPDVWFQSWLTKPINYSTSVNYIVSLSLLFLFNFVFYKKRRIKKVSSNYPVIFLCLLVPYLVWLISAPGIRFGLGLFLLSISLISLPYHNSDQRFSVNKNFQNYTLFSFFLISILLLNRIDTYSSFAYKFQETVQVKTPSILYIDNPLGWGVLPASGKSSCWINTECMPESKQILLIQGSYNYFVHLN